MYRKSDRGVAPGAGFGGRRRRRVSSSIVAPTENVSTAIIRPSGDHENASTPRGRSVRRCASPPWSGSR